jgi:hypothetical protein
VADTDAEHIEVRVRKVIGAKIREARKARGWSRARLVDALNQSSGLITTSKYLSKWEAGDRKPGYVWGPVIEHVLGLDLHTIELDTRANFDVAGRVRADGAVAQVVAKVEAGLGRGPVGVKPEPPLAVPSRPELKADGPVLLPVLVNGRPVLMPVDIGSLCDLLAVLGVMATASGDIGVTAADWEAMSPLNRRSLLQYGIGAAVLPLFGVDNAERLALLASATHDTPGAAPFAPVPPLQASWAGPIYEAVVNPMGAVREARSSGSAGSVAPTNNTTVLRQLAKNVLTAHLSSDYLALSVALPRLIGRTELISLQGDDMAADIQPLLSDIYAVAAWSLIKADRSAAAWLAAQRAVQVAEQVDDVLRVAAATRCLSEVHMRARNFEEATRTAFLATVQLDAAPSTDREAILCLRGAALLSAAAAAARRGDGREAYAALKAAAVCADELGEDRFDLGTVFGPTNVAIHQVAVAVELGDTQGALRHVPAVRLDQMSAALAERRARFLIDVARSHAGQQDDQAALDALLEAERVAPYELREHRLTHELLRDLFGRERRSSGVRQLAARCNLPD